MDPSTHSSSTHGYKSFRSIPSSSYSGFASNASVISNSDDWLGEATSKVESSKDFVTNGNNNLLPGYGHQHVEFKFPFNKLACFDEEVSDDVIEEARKADPKLFTAMVDSSRRITSNDAEDLSRNTSLQTTSSVRSMSNGSLSGVPRSVFQSLGSASSGTENRKLRQTNSTIGDSVILEEPEQSSATEAAPQRLAPSVMYPPQMFPDVGEGVSEIDKAFEGSRNLDADPEFFMRKTAGWKKCKKPDKKFKKTLDPFNEWNQCKNKKAKHRKSQCKWDVFPGIKLADPRYLATPFHKGNLADPRHLGFIATPFRQGRFADPRQLISPFRRKSKSKATQAWVSNDRIAEKTSDSATTTSSTDSDDKDDKEAISSPNGPLSVQMSSMTSRSDTMDQDMEMRLTKTFGHDQLAALEASEQAELDNAKASSTGGKTASEASTHGSWAGAITGGQSQHPRHSKSAPIMHVVDKVKAAIPEAMKYKRSSTAPEFETQLPSAKETGRLRVEKFRGITFVNEYALVRTLGKGTFGTVKLALNTTNHELYALKLLPKSRKHRGNQVGSHKADADVQREIDVMKQLDHPNIVRLHEVIDDPLNSKMLMVLEYTEGGSLFSGSKINPNRRLTELSARKYFRDVLSGLDYLHAHKIAHGDLKPDNLLLASSGHIKIADFGSSQLTRRGEVVKRTTGTPAFMAPELCSGEAYHARLADVWALGVCLYMFVFGVVPFKSDSILGLYDAIQHQPLEFPEDVYISDSLKHLLYRLLDKDPESRISLIGAMFHPWVTHNGAYALPNIQNLESDEEEDRRAMLMECWPDNPACVSMGNILKITAPLFEERIYPDGAFLAKQGEAAKCNFFVLEGEAVVYHTKDTPDDSDSEEEEEVESKREVEDKRKRLRRQGSMLKTMYCATITASRLVSAVREYASGRSQIISRRGSGSFIGEVQFYSKGLEATWQTCVQAKGTTKVLVMHFEDIRDLIIKRPEIEADTRAIMAQRQGELLKMEMLEKLASLHRELMKEVALATEAGGASASAVDTARELLGNENCSNFLKARHSGLSNGGPKITEMQAVCKDGVYTPDGELVRSPAGQEKVLKRRCSEESEPELQPRTSSYSSVRSSINEKGDSAKNLSAYPPCSSPEKLPLRRSQEGMVGTQKQDMQ